MGTHQRYHTPFRIGGYLEGLPVPLHEGGLDFFTLRLAVKDLAHGSAVMRKIGVQSHEALVARAIDACGRVPGRRRRFAVSTQIALATAFDDGVDHVDRDLLRLSAARLPDFGGGKAACSDRSLRRDADAKR